MVITATDQNKEVLFGHKNLVTHHKPDRYNLILTHIGRAAQGGRAVPVVAQAQPRWQSRRGDGQGVPVGVAGGNCVGVGVPHRPDSGRTLVKMGALVVAVAASATAMLKVCCVV